MRSQMLLPPLVSLALACGGAGGGAAVLPIGAAERDLILDASDLAPLFPGTTIDVTREKWTYEPAYDGAYDLEYEYESADSDPNVLFISTMASLEPSVTDASWVYTGADLGLGLAESEGVTLVETPSVLSWGDERKCKQFMTEGVSVGTLCVARKGARVYVASVVGVPFEEPGSMDALLATQLAAFEAWNPKD